jgi:hypothetical protein
MCLKGENSDKSYWTRITIKINDNSKKICFFTHKPVLIKSWLSNKNILLVIHDLNSDVWDS